MPTGYTAYIEDGEITTGKDFLKLCTRAFGIAVDLKDEPLAVPTPNHFEPDTYYKDRYDKALSELDKANRLTFEEAKIQMCMAYENRILDYKRYAENETVKNAKYEKVRKEVEAWVPPTEEHEGLKKFALELITIYEKFIREPKEDEEAPYGEFGCPFLEYKEENIGHHYAEEVECNGYLQYVVDY